jgi:hypothetical protein
MEHDAPLDTTKVHHELHHMVERIDSVFEAPTCGGVYALSVGGAIKIGKANDLRGRLKAYSIARAGVDSETEILIVRTEAFSRLERLFIDAMLLSGFQPINGTREAFACSLQDSHHVLSAVCAEHEIALEFVASAVSGPQSKKTRIANKPKGTIRQRGSTFRAEFNKRGKRKSATHRTYDAAVEWLEIQDATYTTQSLKKKASASKVSFELIDTALLALVGEHRLNEYKKYVTRQDKLTRSKWQRSANEENVGGHKSED